MGGVSPSWPVVLVVVVPLCGALGAFVWPRRAASIGLGVAGLSWVAVVGLVAGMGGEGEWRVAMGGWRAPLGIELRADGLAVVMVVLAQVVGSLASLYAAAYFRGLEAGRGFWVLWLFLWAGLNALFLSSDLFNLYVALEVIGLSAVGLVAVVGGRPALVAALRYLLVGLLGSMSFLLGTALLYGAHGVLDLALLGEAVAGGGGGISDGVGIALMSVGMLMKAALFPLHFWLPGAHANAAAPVSALLSALVVKAPFVVLLRLWFEVYGVEGRDLVMGLLGALGCAAILWGSYQALRQERLKLVVAYSTVAQLGYVFLLFPLAAVEGGGLGGWAGGLYLLVAHGCAKAALFLCVGALQRGAGHDRLADLGAAARAMPVSMFGIALASVSLIGLPPSGGFVGKWILLNAALASGQWWLVLVMGAGTLMAAGYLFRVMRLPFVELAGDGGGGEEIIKISGWMEWVPLTFGLLVVVLGFVAPPLIVLLEVGAPVGGEILRGGGR
jgi:multicomponent Na+:H+ antiporter subunit D